MAENELPVWQQMIRKAQAARQYEEAKNGCSVTRCLSCGQLENIIWVHGHGQCAHCKMNVMPCCDGETSD